MIGFPDNVDLKVVVLTLPHSEDRQGRIRNALEEAGIDFEFVWGVDGRKERDPVFDLYDQSKRLRVRGNPLSAGQLGCFAGHRNIWARCVNENKRYVVFEDDIVFVQETFKAFLKTLEIMPRHFGCLRLFKNKTRNHQEYEVARVGDFSILRYTKGPMSSMGYYLTPDAARKFLDCVSPIFLPVDIYMDRYWVNDVPCLGISPAFVSHDYKFESIIGYEPKTGRRPLLNRLRRELFTLTERIRRFIYNLRLEKKYRGKRLLADER
ncbi:glycosyltransferase family 25 protein [Marinobacter salinisoli]|uniref:Glycosyltransferase family 25 protein n=1 Tax=Marinobacter salinisoli TaxID=2769486 RepID=A0ABX7MUJ0_9GAMM|nr:glycosyltransferase family 25 protein [Marinobacter salinisoli]QSP96055.1 glycosyltransferase family 25 protein [Marinobacter salinisoli]